VNPEEMIDKLSRRLSLPRLVATVVATLGGLLMAAIVGLLWATEPGLPPRAQTAFAVMVAIGLAWAVYGAWALTRRTPLFALDRVISGWLAVAATCLLTLFAGLTAVVWHRGTTASAAAAATLLIVAIVNLTRAHTHRAALLRRKRDLDQRHARARPPDLR
jgi:hypothetical protein